MYPGANGHPGTADGHPEDRLLRALLHHEGSTAVLELHGEADMSTRRILREALATAVSPYHEALVIDLDQLTFCDGGCAQDLLAVARLRNVSLARTRCEVARVLDQLDWTPIRLDWAQLPLLPNPDPH